MEDKQPHGKEGGFRKGARKPKNTGQTQSVKENMIKREIEEKKMLYFSELPGD